MKRVVVADDNDRTDNGSAWSAELLPAEAIHEQLGRILASALFQRSPRHSRFLRYTVEEVMGGRADRLKEYLVGVEVFDRGAEFDPRIESIVRVEARKFRSRLEKYYATEGLADPVRIDLPKGSYAPVFEKREPSGAAPPCPAVRRSPHARLRISLVASALLLLMAGFGVGSSSRRHPAAPPGGAASVELSSIAVLPFEDFSPGRHQERLCEGITEELIHELTKIGGLHVVARTSSSAFKGKHQDIRRIGQELNVRAVLQGTLRQAGNTLRITVQLIGATDGYHLWSETYDRQMKSGFAIQEDVARAVVGKLITQASENGSLMLVRQSPETLEAHKRYLKGRFFSEKDTEADLKKGIEYFEQAIAIDSSYAPAYAGVGLSYRRLGDKDLVPPRQILPKASAALHKALELDRTLSPAHNALAGLKHSLEWDWKGAEREYQGALEVNSADGALHQGYAMCLTAMGQFEQATRELQRAQQLDPLSFDITIATGWAFYCSRRYNEAIRQYHKALKMEPASYVPYHGLGKIYAQASKWPEAVASLQKAIALSGENPNVLGALGYAYAVMGKGDEARKLLDEITELSRRRYVSPAAMALVRLGLGERDRTFELLEKALAEHSAQLEWVRVDPAFDSLRSDARYTSLLTRMGLAN